MRLISTLVLVACVAAPGAAQFNLSGSQIQVGEQFDAFVSGGFPNSIYFIAMDVDPGPVHLPSVDLTVHLGFTAKAFSFPLQFIGPNGTGSMTFPSPNQAFAGIAMHGQAFNFDPVSVFHIVGSNGVKLSVHPAQLNSGVATPIFLTDDDAELVPLGFTFDFYGTDYTDVYVNSNGTLSFGSPNLGFFATEGLFLGGPPSTAPFWADLNPALGGTVEWDTTEFPGLAMVFRYRSVPDNLSSSQATAEVALGVGGHIQMRFSAVDFASCITGITPGGNPPANQRDFNEPGHEGYADPLPIYQVFDEDSPFDLDWSILTFVRAADTGYLVIF